MALRKEKPKYYQKIVIISYRNLRYFRNTKFQYHENILCQTNQNLGRKIIRTNNKNISQTRDQIQRNYSEEKNSSSEDD